MFSLSTFVRINTTGASNTWLVFNYCLLLQGYQWQPNARVFQINNIGRNICVHKIILIHVLWSWDVWKDWERDIYQNALKCRYNDTQISLNPL